MIRRHKPEKTPQAFFIRRQSLAQGDDSKWFHDEGRRVYFEKAVWARHMMVQFTPEQQAQIVRGAILSDDVPYQVFLADVLPEGVSVDEYLRAVEQEARKGQRRRR